MVILEHWKKCYVNNVYKVRDLTVLRYLNTRNCTNICKYKNTRPLKLRFNIKNEDTATALYQIPH